VTEISVVLSWNRPQRLAAMLESACALDVPPDLEWELLVVDNGGGTPSTEAGAGIARRNLGTRSAFDIVSTVIDLLGAAPLPTSGVSFARDLRAEPVPA
jgi:hypothetical protein